MLILATTIAGLIITILAAEFAGVAIYIRRTNSYKVPDAAIDQRTESLPHAAIVVSLRGADPYLEECLDRLAKQDYPSFSLHLVIDHPSDPARQLVERWMATQSSCEVEISFLTELSPDAYLKASAVRQCVKRLKDSTGVVVLADADTVAYRHWLRDMIAPLGRPNVGVVTGNRWYDPTSRSTGSLVRFVYNAFGVVPMYFMRATWGGSLAIRRDVFAQDVFYERMKKTSSEDYAIQNAARAAEVELEVQPNVMILNREDCTLAGCFQFIRRQLIWTRLYHPNWKQLVLGTVGLYLLLATSFVVGIAAAFLGEYLAAFSLGAALAAETVGSLVLIEWLHRTLARRAACAQGVAYPQMTWSGRARLICLLPLSLIVIVWATISAASCRRVRWRGITYEVVPPDGISLVEYRPYAEVMELERAGCSLS